MKGDNKKNEQFDLFDFNYHYSAKLKIYDPLDRDIPEGEPQSIKTEALLNVLHKKTKPIACS